MVEFDTGDFINRFGMSGNGASFLPQELSAGECVLNGAKMLLPQRALSNWPQRSL